LHTEGRWVVDANGSPFTFNSVNWYGAEELDYVPAGLERQDVHAIAHEVRALGFNSVRLLWSNEMVERNPVVDDPRVLAANPDLLGHSALEVFDTVIDALAGEGLLVILDNHTSDAGWCCSGGDGNGLWYNDRYPESSWIADWQELVERYRDQPAVVGADLRNEPRSDGARVASWGGPPETDWRSAAERGGNAVLAVNPDLLVIVEGVSYAGTLEGAATDPVRLDVPGRLVYSAHDYPWYHSNFTTMADIWADLDRRWGFLLEDGQPYTAPVYVGEFGTYRTDPSGYTSLAPNSYGLWFQAFLQYAHDRSVDWAYWALNGTQARAPGRVFGAQEGYGVLNLTWDGPAQPDHVAALQSIMGVPSPWADEDVGAVGYAGSAGQAGDLFAVRGSGADVWGLSDAFHYVDQPLSEDGMIVARVVSLQHTDPWAKAGVMIRSGLGADARHAMVVVSAASGAAFQWRPEYGGETFSSGAPAAAPYWVALVRLGDTLTGYVSADGADWSQVGPTVTIDLPDTVYAGLLVTSHNNGAINTATFDNVWVASFPGGAPPGGREASWSPDLARAASSPLQRVQHGRPAQPHGAVVVVAQAVGRLVLLQGAADVVAAVDHHPAAVVLDPLQGRHHLAELAVHPLPLPGPAPAAHRLDRHPVELLAEQVVVRRDGHQLELLPLLERLVVLGP
jgi:endoglucanase